MILFVGEKPSKTAFERGWTWESRRLASATLHEALSTNGINQGFRFLNLFGDHPDDAEAMTAGATARLEAIRAAEKAGETVVAMGLKVARHLSMAGVQHRLMRHPAARGAGRGKAIYAAHVGEVLQATG